MTNLSGGDYASPIGHESWNDIEKGGSGGGRPTSNGGAHLLGIILIILGIIGAAVFPPIGILIWIGAKLAA